MNTTVRIDRCHRCRWFSLFIRTIARDNTFFQSLYRTCQLFLKLLSKFFCPCKVSFIWTSCRDLSGIGMFSQASCSCCHQKTFFCEQIFHLNQTIIKMSVSINCHNSARSIVSTDMLFFKILPYQQWHHASVYW